MPAKTKIEWADYISNPIKARNLETLKLGHACIKISEGCEHCWASTFNNRLGTGREYTVTNMRDAVTEMFVDDEEMNRIRKFTPRLPKGELTYKNGRSRPVIFPCDMTDIFGTWVSGEWLDRIFQAMWMCQDADWFVLTKRTGRMVEYLGTKRAEGKSPLGNIYIGCTVENQKRANVRREAMEYVSEMGWKTFVSFEPALEAVNWNAWQFLNGMICGGESGTQARPMPLKAARGARDYCVSHDIPFFFKQWGEWAPVESLNVTEQTTFKHKPVEVDGVMMARVGRGLAGHVLDGRVWQEMAK